MSRAPLRRWMRLETFTAAVPLTLCGTLLGLVIVPNYLQAVQLKQRASECVAQTSVARAQQASLQALQDHVQRLQAERERRGRDLPGAADQGLLLGALGRSAEHKGILTSESKSGRMVVIGVPGVAGGKASRRSVETQMSGRFDALHDTLQQAEGLRSLVSVRSVEFVRSPAVQDADAPIEARFTFDEYFNERAAKATPGKDGG